MLGKDTNGLIVSDTSCDDPDARTVLFLHDAFADKSMGKRLATELIHKVWDARAQPGASLPQIQALLVNVRYELPCHVHWVDDARF